MITIEEKKRISVKKPLKPAQILVLGFAIVILIGSFLLNLPIASNGHGSVGYVNALFTATSAVCVTGLAVVDTGTYWSAFGQTVILILIQIGGLGFMTLATLLAFVIGKRISLRERLIMQEALNAVTISGLVRLTRYILVITFSIEGIGAFLLSFKFIPEYGPARGIAYSIFHSISAFCNAGFDLIGKGRSLTPYVSSSYINIVVCVLIVVGGLGFTVIMDLLQAKRYSKLSLHTRLVLKITFILIVIGFVLSFAFEYNNPNTMGNLSFSGKIYASLFQSITPRTAGFNTLPMDQLTMASKLLVMCLMFIGGSPGSTAGGIKTTTMGITLLFFISIIRGKEDTEVYNRRIPKDTIYRAIAIIGIVVICIGIVTLVLAVTETGFSFEEIFFEVISAFGTVGLSLGITADLSILGKLVISIAMFIGRVGILTIVFAIGNRGKNKRGVIRYPEGRVMV